jgi:hypothetical protein
MFGPWGSGLKFFSLKENDGCHQKFFDEGAVLLEVSLPFGSHCGKFLYSSEENNSSKKPF